MKLLINAIPLLGEESGIGNYTRQIATAASQLSDEFELTFFYGYPSRRLLPPPSGSYGSWLSSLRGLARNASLGRRICKKFLYWTNLAASAIRPRRWDCYFEPNFVLLPALQADKKVLTVHDFSCFRYPQWHPEERVRHMEKHFWPSIEKADHIITVSETIRKEACEMFGLDPAKITAIPNGVDHSRYKPVCAEAQKSLRQRYGLPQNFILYVGALEPRKNLLNLLSAHANLPQPLKQRYPLILIGSRGWNNQAIMEQIHRQAPYTRLLGYVAASDLPVFYSAASLFVYPSWYEGFGLPALEAMACGRPVLTSTDAALQELCGDAAHYVHPADQAALTSGMERLLEDAPLAEELAARALKRAAAYSWSESSARHMRVFKSLG